MKKVKYVLTLILALFAIQGYALSFTVTVPSGTNAVYIAGSFNGWNPSSHQLTKVNDNTYSIDIETSSSGIKYKYCSGPGWEYVERNTSGNDIADRSYNASDNVARWATVYNPALTPGNITITANVPANTPDGEVYITGSFTSPTWDPTAAIKMNKLSSTQYRITIANVTDIEYKFLCGHSWENEELASDGGSVVNRSASVASPNVSVTVARWKSTEEPAANVLAHTFLSFTPLQGSRRVLIYLPPDYETNTDKHYPVLYMHDAQNVLETGPFGTWNAQNTLNQRFNDGKEVGIVVAIDNGPGRLKEYTPFGNSSYEGGVAQGDEYLTAIKNHVIPYINANYRTLTDREHTGIMGSSMGGLISYYAALKEQDTFGLIAPMSPSFWFCKNALSNYVDSWDGVYKDNTKIYFICGSNEDSGGMVSNMQEFYNKTVQKGFKENNLEYEVVSGATHSEGSWAAQFERVYNFLFEDAFLTDVDGFKTNGIENISISTDKNRLIINNNNESTLSLTLYNSLGVVVSKHDVPRGGVHINLTPGIYFSKMVLNQSEQSNKIIVN